MKTPTASMIARWRLGLVLGTAAVWGVCLTTVAPVHASVALHTVTPENVDEQTHIDVRVETRPSGDATLTLTVERAMVVYPPQVTIREGAKVTEIAWPDPDADPLTATVEIPAADVDTATVSVLRDQGLVGHRYVITVADWVDVDD